MGRMQARPEGMWRIRSEDSAVAVKEEPGRRQHGRTDSLRSLFNYSDSRGIACIYRIESLLLLCRIAAIIISWHPVDVFRRLPRKTAPAPEIHSGKKTALAAGFRYTSEHMLIISVPCGCRCALGEFEIVTRETEFFKYDRLSVFFSHFQMLVNICVRVLERLSEICGKSGLTHPVPVVRPHVDIHIVNVRAGMYFFEKFHADLTAPFALASGRHHMIGVQGFDERSRAPHEINERLLNILVIRKTARLIADLPRENSRVILIFPAGDRIGAGNHMLHMVCKQFLGPVIRHEF